VGERESDIGFEELLDVRTADISSLLDFNHTKDLFDDRKSARSVDNFKQTHMD
jgi:hypothetical protein